MKKKLIIIITSVIVLLAVICSSFVFFKTTDAKKFKKEYESLNDVKREKDSKKIRSISIDKDNPIVYSNAKEVVEKMNNGDTFAVYFGFSDCPWCRSVLPTLLEVSKDLGIEKLYYVDVKDIRDTLVLNKYGDVVVEKKGSSDYYSLINKLDNVLEKYILTTEDGEEKDTLEKRIFAPNIVAIVEGVAQELTTGISEAQDDPYMEITKEMKTEMYNKIKCTLECLEKNSKVCVKKAC